MMAAGAVAARHRRGRHAVPTGNHRRLATRPLPTGLDQAADHGAFSMADPAATTVPLEGSGFSAVTVTFMLHALVTSRTR